MDYNQIPTPPQVKPNNYMVLAILTTLFCFLPTGIVAIIYASKVDSLWHAQQYQAAYDAAGKAKNWSIISASVGALVIIVYVILMVAFGAALFNAQH